MKELIRREILDASATPVPRFTGRTVRLPGVPGKEMAVIGPRRAEYYALYPEWRDKRQATFFLDEIQVVAGWERFVRRVLDTERADISLSGCSARLLSREVATQMRGRDGGAGAAVQLSRVPTPRRPCGG